MFSLPLLCCHLDRGGLPSNLRVFDYLRTRSRVTHLPCAPLHSLHLSISLSFSLYSFPPIVLSLTSPLTMVNSPCVFLTLVYSPKRHAHFFDTIMSDLICFRQFRLCVDHFRICHHSLVLISLLPSVTVHTPLFAVNPTTTIIIPPTRILLPPYRRCRRVRARLRLGELLFLSPNRDIIHNYHHLCSSVDLNSVFELCISSQHVL